MGDCNIYQNAAVCGSISVYDPAWVISGDDKFSYAASANQVTSFLCCSQTGGTFSGSGGGAADGAVF